MLKGNAIIGQSGGPTSVINASLVGVVHGAKAFDGIEKVDNLTVLLHLSRQDSNLLRKVSLTALGMVSPDVLAAEGDNYGMPGSAIAGTGPYIVGEWTADMLVLEPNPNYWGEEPTETLEFPLE